MSDEEYVETIEDIGGVTNQPVPSVGNKYVAVCEVGDPCRWTWTHPLRETARAALLRHNAKEHPPEPPTREEHVTDWLQGMPQPARALYAFDPEFVAWVRHGARLAQASDGEIARDPAEREQLVQVTVQQGKGMDKEAFQRAVEGLSEQKPGRFQ